MEMEMEMEVEMETPTAMAVPGSPEIPAAAGERERAPAARRMTM